MEKYTDYSKTDLTADELKNIKWTKYKIIVPTEEDRQSLMEAFEHIHYSDIDTNFVPVNQLAHEYLDEEREPGSKNNIITDKDLYEQLQAPQQNKTFKIISRHTGSGRQFKKRVYTSEKDYLNYKDIALNSYFEAGKL